jgi:hypothetical protein
VGSSSSFCSWDMSHLVPHIIFFSIVLTLCHDNASKFTWNRQVLFGLTVHISSALDWLG